MREAHCGEDIKGLLGRGEIPELSYSQNENNSVGQDLYEELAHRESLKSKVAECEIKQSFRVEIIKDFVQIFELKHVTHNENSTGKEYYKRPNSAHMAHRRTRMKMYHKANEYESYVSNKLPEISENKLTFSSIG